MRALDAKRDEARAACLADAAGRRTKAPRKIAGLDQEITKARQKESHRRLLAPVDGTVRGVDGVAALTGRETRPGERGPRASRGRPSTAPVSPFADIERGMSAFATEARCGVDER